MKKRTKIASLFLAMLMAFSLMAVTASAYDAGHAHDETCAEAAIQPRKPAAWCHSCSQAMVEKDIVEINGGRYIEFRCATCPNYVYLPW